MPADDARDPSDARRSVDEFIAAVEHDLVRAAWLITTDRHRATELTEHALATITRHWNHATDTQPVEQAYTALTNVLTNDAKTAVPPAIPPPPPDAGRTALRQHQAEQAFTTLPLTDRMIVVLHRYANLTTHQVARLTHTRENTIEQRSDHALRRLREHTTDLTGIPWDDTPAPSPAVDHQRIHQLAANEKSTTRRHLLFAAAAATTLTASAAALAWQNRTPSGKATINPADAAALRPPELRSTGLIFTRLRTDEVPKYGHLFVIGDNTTNGDFRLQLTPAGSSVNVTRSGRPLRFKPTAWGDLSVQVRKGDAQGPESHLVIGQVPSDTDIAWIIGGGVVLGTAVSGTELADHSTYAGGMSYSLDSSSVPIDGMVWFTKSQRIGLGQKEVGELGDLKREIGVAVFAQNKLWCVFDPESQWLTLLPLEANRPSEMVGVTPEQKAIGTVLLPKGATNVSYTTNPRVQPHERFMTSVGNSDRTAVMALQEPTEADRNAGTIPNTITEVRWTDAAGKTQTWKPQPQS